MSRINILYIINELAHGGTEKQLVQLIRRLDRSQFQPHIAILYSTSAFLKELDIPSIQVDFNSFKDRELFRKILRLRRFARKHDIQIVQTFFQDPHLIGAILKCCLPLRLVGSFRDLGFWQTFMGRAKIRLCDFLYDGYIANSEAVRRYSSAAFGIKLGKIECIYNGFPYDECAALTRHASREADSKVVGIVANLNRKVKRVEDFVAMASVVKNKIPDSKFVIIGDGHLKEELVSMSGRLGLRESISFLGTVPNPVEYIPNFRVGVITSESEGFSNAIIEYMACGVPVVATNVGGNSEMIISGENGYLVPVGRPALMAEKVIFLLENPSHAQSIGLANREKVLRNYTVKQMIADYQTYYELILHGRA